MFVPKEPCPRRKVWTHPRTPHLISYLHDLRRSLFLPLTAPSPSSLLRTKALEQTNADLRSTIKLDRASCSASARAFRISSRARVRNRRTYLKGSRTLLHLVFVWSSPIRTTPMESVLCNGELPSTWLGARKALAISCASWTDAANSTEQTFASMCGSRGFLLFSKTPCVWAFVLPEDHFLAWKAHQLANDVEASFALSLFPLADE